MKTRGCLLNKLEAKINYLNRVICRANRAAGYFGDNIPNKWYYEYNGQSGTVVAVTCSEARALIKKELGISRKHRLPKNVIIERKEKYVENQ